MKNTLCFIALVLTVSFFKAQDQLYKKDNTILQVKVIEINPNEIKYKLHVNLNGPTYIVNKSEVSVLIYENGRHEVFVTAHESTPQPSNYQRPSLSMNKADSSLYFKYQNNLSLNFLSFVNMEVGVIYQHDFYKNNCNITIPFAIGIVEPAITKSIYFNKDIYDSNNGSAYSSLDLKRKFFELGFGLNYYPSLRFPVNYYIGPAIRYMQYGVTQRYSYSEQNASGTNYNTYKTVFNNAILSRYCVSITNGFVFRTKSRIVLNMFASIGFKNDAIDKTIADPRTNKPVKTLAEPIGLYFWSGFTVGYSF